MESLLSTSVAVASKLIDCAADGHRRKVIRRKPAVQQGLPSVPHVAPLQEPSAHMFEEPNVQLPPAETHLPFHGSLHPLSHFAPGQHG